MITLNGKEKDYREITITELLEKEGLAGVRVAVELNGQIIRKNNFENVIVKDMDKVEVVSFVGGGWFRISNNKIEILFIQKI